MENKERHIGNVCYCSHCLDVKNEKYAAAMAVKTYMKFAINAPMVITLIFGDRTESKAFNNLKDAREWYSPKISLKMKIYYFHERDYTF